MPRCPCTRGTCTDTATAALQTGSGSAWARLGTRGEARAGGGLGQRWLFPFMGRDESDLLAGAGNAREVGGCCRGTLQPEPLCLGLCSCPGGSPCSLGLPGTACLGWGKVSDCSSVIAAQTQRGKGKLHLLQPQKLHRFLCKPLGAALQFGSKQFPTLSRPNPNMSPLLFLLSAVDHTEIWGKIPSGCGTWYSFS